MSGMSASSKQRMTMFQPDLPVALKHEQFSQESYAQLLIRLLSGDLGFHGQKTSYTTHTWHAFPAKFPPQLPEVFIRELTAEHDVELASCFTYIIYSKNFLKYTRQKFLKYRS
jgi:hypothetical protein